MSLGRGIVKGRFFLLGLGILVLLASLGLKAPFLKLLAVSMNPPFYHLYHQ